MCGIAAFSLNPDERPINANRLARLLLLGIEHRGHHATGAAWRDRGDIIIEKRGVTASNFVKGLSVPKKARTAVLHTRHWTQGPPAFNENNHPIRSGTIVGVHNGMVWNDTEVFDVCDTAPRTARVDSEAIFALLAYGANHYSNVTHDVDLLEYIEGSAAIAYMDVNEDDNVLHLARLAGSPLAIAQTSAGSLVAASEASVVREAMEAMGLDIAYMDPDVDEGTYLRIRDGLIVEERTFEVHPYTWSKTTVATPIVAKGAKVSGSYDEDWCSRHGEWLDFCKACEAEIASAAMTEEDTPRPLDVEHDFANMLFEGALLYLDRDIPARSPEEWEMCYGERATDIHAWVEEADVNSMALEPDYKHIFTRPGDWVQTEMAGQPCYGQVVEVPQRFPGGEYLLRLLAPREGPGLRGMEGVLVVREGGEFTPLSKDKFNTIDKQERVEALASDPF